MGKQDWMKDFIEINSIKDLNDAFDYMLMSLEDKKLLNFMDNADYIKIIKELKEKINKYK